MEIYRLLVYNVAIILMIGDLNMTTENNNKGKKILIHSKQGSNDGTIRLEDLIKEKQKKNTDKDKGDEES